MMTHEQREALQHLSDAVERVTEVGIATLPPAAVQKITALIVGGTCRLRMTIEPQPMHVELAIIGPGPQECTTIFAVTDEGH